jgi:hypothetical protein
VTKPVLTEAIAGLAVPQVDSLVTSMFDPVEVVAVAVAW